MKRSGLSVVEANRVIEIEEVFDARSVSGAEVGREAGEDGFLDHLVLGGRLDRQIGRADLRQGRADLDPGEARGHRLVLDDPSRDLTGHVALDHSEAGAGPRLVDIVDQDVIAAERANVGDAAAHLARADYADRPDLRHSRPREAAQADENRIFAPSVTASLHDARLYRQHPAAMQRKRDKNRAVAISRRRSGHPSARAPGSCSRRRDRSPRPGRSARRRPC